MIMELQRGRRGGIRGLEGSETPRKSVLVYILDNDQICVQEIISRKLLSLARRAAARTRNQQVDKTLANLEFAFYQWVPSYRSCRWIQNLEHGVSSAHFDVLVARRATSSDDRKSLGWELECFQQPGSLSIIRTA